MANKSSTETARLTALYYGPTANPDWAATRENEIVLIDVLANDGDGKARLTVTAAGAPASQGKASIVDGMVQFDPGSDFDDLAAGESEIVVVGYTIEDEQGASSSSTATITVSGVNDAPIANPDSVTTSRDSGVVIDVLANDRDPDNGALLTVTRASVKPGQGSVSIVENEIRFDPGKDFDHLGVGESAVVYVRYTIKDEHGASASSTVAVTVTGREHRDENTPSDDGETLIGTKGDDWIAALGGDDSVFGLAGDDLLLGGTGSDFLSGEEGHDVLGGGDDDDSLSGGQGDDQLFGEAGNDHLAGEHGHDRLSGGDGLDSLDGGSGDDVLEGGNDDDALSGEEGDDRLFGEAGNDLLSGEGGRDELSGGEGNDSIGGGGDDDSLDGGDGDDILSGGLGSNIMNGGLGRDRIVADSTDAAQTIDGGDGDDTISHLYRLSASTITTGSGRDSIELLHANVGKAAIIVTDFQPGEEGDVFQLSGTEGSILSLLRGWDGLSNPFGSGFLRLEQGESGTLLQWDRDGEGRKWGWETLVIFEGTDTGAFTDFNFAPGFHPDGSPPPDGRMIVGTKEGDTLTGTPGDDSIDALSGDDAVFGFAGADVIKGGDGLDFLYGDEGDDVVEGGYDDDVLSGGEGNDQLLGDAGSDSLAGEAGEDALSGGDGNDSLDGGDGDDLLDGGDGEDFLYGGLGFNILKGGLGNDRIVADSTDWAQSIDGGDGDDSIIHSYRYHASTIVTGSGRDTIELLNAHIGKAAIAVTDFTPGSEGDFFRLSGEEGSLLGLLVGWDDSSNPFGTGFLRLEQGELGALLQWDRDGEGRDWDWETLVVFERIDARAFTEFNFGFDPFGLKPVGQNIVGTNEDEILVGTAWDDSIEALGGSDSAFGRGGADFISGGDGADFLYGDGGDDTLHGRNHDDSLAGGAGHDSLSGDAGNDYLLGELGDDWLSGGDGADGLDGGDGDDRLEGGAGQDNLAGGPGADLLSGGADADLFGIHSASSGADEITDFVAGTDKILIWADGFGGGLVAGGPVSLVSGTNPTASEPIGQFLYDSDDGRLFWDADGTGTGAAVLVATLSNVPPLAASDFVVV